MKILKHRLKSCFVSSLCLFPVLVALQNAAALPHQSQKMAIAAPGPHAVAAAQEIARKGGNVFDQAIAAALSLSVTHPYYAAFGGGGFAVLRVKKSDGQSLVTTFDFREMAPAAATRDQFVKAGEKSSTQGGLASGVPGIPAGLEAIHKAHGKLKWRTLFAPALRLAEQGHAVSGEWVMATQDAWPEFNKAAQQIFGRVVLDKSRPPRERYEVLTAGDIIKQPRLAKALKLFRDRGARAFYQGEIGRDVVSSVQAAGGNMTLEDLKNYKVVQRAPVQLKWRGHDLYFMGLPSSGGLVASQALQLIDRLEQKHGVPAARSAEEAHMWGEALKLAFASRMRLGDVDSNPQLQDIQTQLFAGDRLDRLAGLFSPKSVIVPLKSKSPDLRESLAPATKTTGETTHFSIADAEGQAVAMTLTMNENYGSGVVTEKFGVVMNDQMDDFATRPGEPNQFGLIQGSANEVLPGRRPLSSMTPVIVERDGEFAMTAGAPGGPRIISGVTQAVLRVITQNADAEAAVTLPRVHHQFLPETLMHDPGRFAPEVLAKLRALGHELTEGRVAKVYVVRRTRDGLLEAAADPRGEAASGGW